MGKFRTRIILTACSTLFAVGSVSAQNAPVEKKWSELPSLKRRVAITEKYDKKDTYDDLRSCVRNLRSQVGASYYIAMPEISDPTGSRSRKKSDATEYATFAWEKWKSKKVSPEKHVILATGISNRSLGLHLGTSWETLGLKDKVLEDTIAQSDWTYFVKKRSRTNAICSLITRIDYKLKALTDEREKDLATANAAKDLAAANLQGFEGELDKQFDDSHVFANTLRASLSTANNTFEEAIKTLDADPKSIPSAADALNAEIDKTKQQLAVYQNDMKTLEGFETELAEAKKETEERLSLFSYPGGSDAASENITNCETLAKTVRNAFEQPPHAVKTCIEDHKRKLTEGDVRSEYRTQVLPAIFAGFAVLLGLLFVAFALRRRKKLAQTLDADIEMWGETLRDGRASLEAIVEKHSTYLRPRSGWTGEAQNLDRKAISKLNVGLKLTETLEQTLENARALRGGGSPLSTGRLDKGLKTLRTTDIHVEASPPDPRASIDIGPQPIYDTDAKSAIVDYAKHIRETELTFVDVGTVMAELTELTTRSANAYNSVTQAIEARSKFGFQVDDLVETRDILSSAYENARKASSTDPVVAIAQFEILTEELESFDQRVSSGNRVISQIRSGLIERLANLRGYYVRLVNNGFDLEEPDFNPARMLDELSNDARNLVEQVRGGDEIGAVEKLDALQTQMRRLARWLRACETAPQILPDMLTGIVHQCECAKNDILKIRVVFVKQDVEFQEQYKDEITRLSEFLSVVSKSLITADKARKAFTSRKLFGAVKMVQSIIDPINDGLPLTQQLAALTGVDLTFEGMMWPLEWDDAAVESIIT